MPMYLNFAEQKIKIFHYFLIPKSKNSEITEIYQNPQNTEI